jgi:hypothetical protein
MKVKVVKTFRDLKADRMRKGGEVFICSKERFKEISDKLPGYVEEHVEEKPATEDVSAE